MRALSLEILRSIGLEEGLSVVASASPEDLVSDQPHLSAWQDAGLAGEMGYMNRPPDRLSSPRSLMPGVRSVVVIAVSYDQTPRGPLEVGHGRIARYAWGRDYHKVMRRRLEGLVGRVERHLGRSIEHRLFSDSVPLLERALAKRAGIAFIGKNTMAIIPRRGSFFFLGEVLWDVEIENGTEERLAPSHCGSCSRCLTECPTEAFVKERVLDASRCISYLTIEKRGSLSYGERSWLGEWLFGCDVCQEVCPFNAISLKRRGVADLRELSAGAGVGPSLPLGQVLRLRSDTEFTGAFQGTAIMRAKRSGLLRNAAVVAANTHAVELFPLLCEIAQNDPSTLVRQHALWATAVIAGKEGGRAIGKVQELLLTGERSDSDIIREEALAVRSRLRNFA